MKKIGWVPVNGECHFLNRAGHTLAEAKRNARGACRGYFRFVKLYVVDDSGGQPNEDGGEVGK